eukprot:Sspe_Gene.67133::Locus_39638_Transcript_1_1_Confidence_1.000_Length_1518::g.67133::m.67133
MAIPSAMEALIKRTDSKGYEYTSVEVPRPGPHQTLVKIIKVGVCGSDIPLHEWTEVGKSIATLPFIPGHEAVGKVVAIGPSPQPECAAHIRVGDKVGIENHYYCETCYQCLHGVPHICAKMGQLGHGKLGFGPGMDTTIAMQGGCAEFALVPTKMLFKLTRGISDVQAALLEPMGVAHHGCEAAEVTKGDDCLIIGCGAIGLLASQIAKAMGASCIIVADIDDGKLKLAKEKCGAHVTVNTRRESLKDVVMRVTEGNGVGHLVECSGVPAVVDSCFELVRKGGNVCLLGIPKARVHPTESGKDFVFRSRTVRGIHGRKIFHTWDECERLIAEGKCRPEVVVTHDFPLRDYKEAFGVLLGGRGIKILMTPGHSAGSKM